MDELFIKAMPVLAAIEDAGFEAYFVGGSVRDYLVGREINDVDIATSATPLEIKDIFTKTVDVGIEHGTVLVLHPSGSYEITTFRTESTYSDFRRPDQVNFVRSLRDDLKRRDFTMNAIAMDKKGTIYDPFQGETAIHNKQIVTVGSPDERFTEDGLRMMRALRFVSQLGFELDKNTFDSLKKNGQLLTHISVERMLVEFEKLLQGKDRKKALQLLVDSNLHTYLPGLKNEKQSIEKLMSYPLLDLEDAVEIWAAFVLTMNVGALEPFLRSWKMSIKQMREIMRIAALVKESNFISNKVLLFHAGRHGAMRAANVKAVLEKTDRIEAKNMAARAYDELIIHSISELTVSGNDLLTWDKERKPGPWVKQSLDCALEAVLEFNTLNDKASIKEWLEKCNLI